MPAKRSEYIGRNSELCQLSCNAGGVSIGQELVRISGCPFLLEFSKTKVFLIISCKGEDDEDQSP